jgi:hypothetical protein
MSRDVDLPAGHRGHDQHGGRLLDAGVLRASVSAAGYSVRVGEPGSSTAQGGYNNRAWAGLAGAAADALTGGHLHADVTTARIGGQPFRG